MAESLYEGMFLLDSSRFASDPEGVAKRIVQILEKAGGEVVAHRPWQDGKLAYEIEGNRKGTHYLTYFRMNGTRLGEVNRACRLSDVVLRHLVVKHPQRLFEMMVEALTGHELTREGEEAEAKSSEGESASDSDDDDSKEEE